MYSQSQTNQEKSKQVKGSPHRMKGRRKNMGKVRQKKRRRFQRRNGGVANRILYDVTVSHAECTRTDQHPLEDKTRVLIKIRHYRKWEYPVGHLVAGGTVNR